jgi:hypothetical protein
MSADFLWRDGQPPRVGVSMSKAELPTMAYGRDHTVAYCPYGRV